MARQSKSSKGGKQARTGTPTIQNRKARHDFHILESMECGIVLTGAEVKSIRQGNANLKEAYARIIGEELWLIGFHITQYVNQNTFELYNAIRDRKLLLHKKQIKKLTDTTQQKGLTLVPLKIYFTRGYAKLELGIGKGKKTHDKREDLKEKAMKREIDQAMKRG